MSEKNTRKNILAPSILAADFSVLGQQIKEAAGAGAGSRCSAMTRASCWTRSRAQNRRGGEGLELEDALGAAKGIRARALLYH